MKSKHAKGKSSCSKDNKNANVKNKHVKEKNKNKKMKAMLLNFLQLIFLCLMIYSGTKIYFWWKDNQANDEIMQEISANTKNGINFEKLKQINDETVAYLKVNGTNIDYPVVQHKDNDYYLSHSFDKSENGAGWIFADFRNNIDDKNKNLIIYGHNRRDGSMFGSLKNILNQDWYNNEENLKITFITENETQIYELFSVYTIEKEDYYITTDFTEETYKEFLNTIKGRSINDFDVDVEVDDSILTLSTCGNNNKYRVVLHAKKLK